MFRDLLKFIAEVWRDCLVALRRPLQALLSWLPLASCQWPWLTFRGPPAETLQRFLLCKRVLSSHGGIYIYTGWLNNLFSNVQHPVIYSTLNRYRLTPTLATCTSLRDSLTTKVCFRQRLQQVDEPHMLPCGVCSYCECDLLANTTGRWVGWHGRAWWEKCCRQWSNVKPTCVGRVCHLQPLDHCQRAWKTVTGPRGY